MIVLFFLSAFYSSCSTNELIDPEEEVIASFCDHDSISIDTIYFDLDGDIIKIPSVFTPNDDGDTDFFYPTFDRGSDEIWISQYAILTPEDEWDDVRLLYSTPVLTYEGDKVLNAWDGISDNIVEPYLEEHEGAFRFRFFVERNDGVTINCEGWGCVDRTK